MARKVEAVAEVVLTPERTEEICGLVCRELERAGQAGFPAMKFFGHIRFRRPGPLGLRRQAWIGHLLEATGISKEEIIAFREAMSAEMKVRIYESANVWRAKMNDFWRSETARFKAEAAVAV